MSRAKGPAGARTWVLAALASGLCACVSAGDRAGPITYLDPDTGTTFVAVARPLVFSHARSELAARSRDYASVAAASVDRSGRVEYVLLVYFWSTVDPRIAPVKPGPTTGLVLAAEDRRIALEPISLAVPPIDRPPARHIIAMMYRTDFATLRYLAAVRRISLLRADTQGTERYRLWDDERTALADLVRSPTGPLP